jgi:2-polyprenyl-3-methyl-5-hydroxy-6-metoxy-1,4-benzoquinol methylase
MVNDYRERLYSRYVKTHLSAVDLELRLSMREPFMRNLIQSYFPGHKDAQILELGCGHGALIYHATKMGYTNIKGVDVSVQQVEAAQLLGISGVEQGDLFATIKSVADNSLDAVVTIDVIEHLTKNELIDFSEEVYRVLGNNGRWITHQPNAASPFFGRIRYGDLTHENALTSKSIHQLMSYSGFSTINSYEDVPISHGLKSKIRLILWLVLRKLLGFYLVVETGSSSEIFSQNFLAVGIKSRGQ